MLHVTTEKTMADDVAKRVQKHRAGLRAAGLRPIQIWVPDTRQRGFAALCRRQSKALTDDPHEVEVLEWLAEAADTDGWK